MNAHILITALFVASFAMACRKAGDGAGAGDASAPSPRIAPETSSGPAPSADADWAYLLASQPWPSDVAQKGLKWPSVTTLVAIDPAGAVARVTVPTGRIDMVRRASDGRAYALVSSSGTKVSTVQVLRLSGRAVESAGEVPGCSRPSAFDVRGDHVVVHCEGVGLLERQGAGAWTTLAVPGDGVVPSAWISKTGTLWFGSTDGLYERIGTAWSSRVLPKPNVEPIDYFDGPDGVYVSVRNTGLLRVRGQALVQVWPHSTNRRVLCASSNGTTGELDDDRRSTLRLDTLASMGTTVNVESALSYRSSVDDRGRVWGVHEGRIVVVDTKTGGVERVPMGAYAELDYVEPQAIVLIDRGPRVPRPQAVRKTKRLEIRLAPGDKPAANADVELCPSRFAKWFSGKSPCSGVDASLVLRTRTDAKGNLAIDDVPMGTYYLHWKGVGDAKWQTDVFMVPLREGELSNVGTISRMPTGT